MSINSEMTSLADAVRDITDWSDQLTIGEMTSALNSITRDWGNTITPASYDQVAASSGTLIKGDIIVQGEPNLTPENIAEGISIFGVEGTHSGDTGGVPNTCDITVDLSQFSDLTGMIAYTGIDPSGTHTEPLAIGVKDEMWDCTAATGSCLVIWLNGCVNPTIDISNNSDITVLSNSWNQMNQQSSSTGVIAFSLSNSLVGSATITLSSVGGGIILPDDPED